MMARCSVARIRGETGMRWGFDNYPVASASWPAGRVDTNQPRDPVEVTIRCDDSEDALPLNYGKVQGVSRLQGRMLIVELRRQNEIVDGDRQRIKHDLKKEFGYFDGPPALSQSGVAVENLLEDLDIRGCDQIPGGDGIQYGNAGSFQRMLGANSIHGDVGVDEVNAVTQARNLASTPAPSVPSRLPGD
jgi:hypothetical protein